MVGKSWVASKDRIFRQFINHAWEIPRSFVMTSSVDRNRKLSNVKNHFRCLNKSTTNFQAKAMIMLLNIFAGKKPYNCVIAFICKREPKDFFQWHVVLGVFTYVSYIFWPLWVVSIFPVENPAYAFNRISGRN